MRRGGRVCQWSGQGLCECRLCSLSDLLHYGASLEREEASGESTYCTVSSRFRIQVLGELGCSPFPSDALLFVAMSKRVFVRRINPEVKFDFEHLISRLTRSGRTHGELMVEQNCVGNGLEPRFESIMRNVGGNVQELFKDVLRVGLGFLLKSQAARVRLVCVGTLLDSVHEVPDTRGCRHALRPHVSTFNLHFLVNVSRLMLISTQPRSQQFVRGFEQAVPCTAL